MTIYIKILILCSLIIYKAHSLNDDSVSVSKPEFSISHFQKTIRFLGSDFLEGRGTGTQGGNLAAKYLAQEFDRIGLIPIGDNGSFYQKIPMLGSKQQQDSKLKCCLAWDTVNFILFKDYALLKSGEETFIPNPLPLAFAGYGIIAPEYDYNDYQNLDVKDKIVVILDGEPSSEDRAFFDGDKETIHSIYESKLRAALSRGAAGVVIVPLLNPGRKNWDDIMNEYKFEDVILAYNPSSNLGLLMNPKSAEVLFKDSGYALSDIYKMHIEKRLWSFPLKTKLSFRGDFQQRSFIADNIIGMLEGSNPKLKDTYLIISAHYDHLGIGPAIGGDSIYNGVSDNAMGVAALLEIAEAMDKMPVKPLRSVIFLLTTGEEKGLLGSSYYTGHPVKPLYKTIANVNIDGIAYFEQFRSIVGIGADYSTLEHNLLNVAAKMGIKPDKIPQESIQGESFAYSDQYSFARAGVPSVLIYEGSEYHHSSYKKGLERLINYSLNVYHTPFDDMNQQINYEAAEEHINLIYNFCLDLANDMMEPEWNYNSPFLNERLRTKAERR